jgi:hypothetical protein
MELAAAKPVSRLVLTSKGESWTASGVTGTAVAEEDVDAGGDTA